jgi:NAD(P)-dependent dehydrogenase (short-subunit alcohol dehydrogenase family)
MMADVPLMAGKSVLVTGGTGGIGNATAIGLAAVQLNCIWGCTQIGRFWAAARPLTTTYADSLTSDYTRLPKVST